MTDQVETVGFSPSQTIGAGALLRLTFVKDTGIFSPSFGYDVFFDQWPAKMARTWAQLPNLAALFPISPANVPPNGTSTTVDARTHAARSGVELLEAVQNMADPTVRLVRVELLTGTAAQLATSDQGAAARDAATQAGQAKQDANSWWSQLGGALKGAGTAVKWTAGAAVVLLLVVIVWRVKK